MKTPKPVKLPAQPPPERRIEQMQVVIGAIERQRNNALAEGVNMQVEMYVMQKRIEQLEKHIEASGGEVPDVDAVPGDTPPPAKPPNGAAEPSAP